VLETSPRVSGRLWRFDGTQAKRFKASGVSSVEVASQGKILEVSVKSGERIIGAEFNSENQVALWTEKGNIYKLDFGKNSYWKVGKPGVVSCASFHLSPPHHLVVGLTTGRAVVIDTVTGAIRCRFVENCDILKVGGSPDGLVVFTMCGNHTTLWDITSKQAKHRLDLHAGDSLQFVSILQGGSGWRVLSATRGGKIGVWGMKAVAVPCRAKRNSAEKLDLVKEEMIGDVCQGFCILNDVLYVVTGCKVVKIHLENGNSEKVANIPKQEKVLGIDVKLFADQAVIVLHLERKSLFLKNGEVIDEVYCFGPGFSSQDGFLLGKVLPDGALQFYRTDSSWGKTVKTVDKVTTMDRATGEASAVTADKAIATSNEVTVEKVLVRNATDIRKGDTKVASKESKSTKTAENVDVNKAERDYEELLTQITSSTLLPLLRSGLLSYPPLPRPTIWTHLLRLPRNKRLYLQFCRSHKTSPEDVISNLLHWSPHLKLVPHLQPFLSPFLRLFSGHPTTSFELCLVLLTKYSWLSSYPSSPPVLSLAWSLLSSKCPDLTTHLSSLSVNSRTLFWPLLQAGWSSVLPHHDWARLWDHLITTGPELMVTALPATILSLQTILLSCNTHTMVHNLLSNQPALSMEEVLNSAYLLLDKHHSRVTSILDKPGIGVLTAAGYPAPIKLDREGREVLAELNTTNTNSDNTKQVGHYSDSQVIKHALAVSPPPVPRARGNIRDGLCKENLGFRPAADRQTFQPVSYDPLAPLEPAYPSTQALPPLPSSKQVVEEEWEDITALLQKAKFLRNVIQAKK